jgi:hypothetical protein
MIFKRVKIGKKFQHMVESYLSVWEKLSWTKKFPDLRPSSAVSRRVTFGGMVILSVFEVSPCVFDTRKLSRFL